MVEGLSELERRWGAIPGRIKKNVRYEMEQQAYKIIEEMYALAPQLTGDLAGSINFTWGDAPAGTLTLGTVGGNEYGSMRLTIYAGGSDAFYARFQEFGTVKMPANPFFFPVWRARRKRTRGAITRAINKAIKAT